MTAPDRRRIATRILENAGRIPFGCVRRPASARHRPHGTGLVESII